MYEKAGRGGRESAFGGGYEKAANPAACLSFVVVVEAELLNLMTLTPTQSFTSLMRCWSGVSSLRTNTFAAFSTSPTDPTFSGLPPISW